MGLVVGEYTPSRGQDKIARLNSVSDMFRSGIVWVPRTRWAEEVIDEVASFPAGAHDDFVDSLAIACAMSINDTTPYVETFEAPWFR